MSQLTFFITRRYDIILLPNNTNRQPQNPYGIIILEAAGAISTSSISNIRSCPASG